MSQCAQCVHDGYRYEFSKLRGYFSAGKTYCEGKRGTLAKYLNEDAYVALRKCCANEKEYWIGLIENPECASSSVGSYTWLGNTTCTNACPLNISRFLNGKDSQAVTIKLDANLTKPPDAAERYNSEIFGFLCQFPFVSSTTALFRISTNSIASEVTVTTVSGTDISSGSGAGSGNLSFGTSSTRATSSVNENSIQIISYAALTGIIAGSMAILICLLIGIIVYNRNKKHKFKPANCANIAAIQAESSLDDEAPDPPNCNCNTSFSKSSSPHDSSKNLEYDDTEDPSGYITANTHTKGVFQGSMQNREMKVEPYAVVGPNLIDYDSGVNGYCNISPRDRSVTALNKISPLPLYNPEHRDGYATVDSPHTYVVFENSGAEEQEEREDFHEYDVITAQQSSNENDHAA